MCVLYFKITRMFCDNSFTEYIFWKTLLQRQGKPISDQMFMGNKAKLLLDHNLPFNLHVCSPNLHCYIIKAPD